jgi:fucose permease
MGGLVGAAVPLVLGVVASSAGLQPTMWILVLAPLALFAASRSSKTHLNRPCA